MSSKKRKGRPDPEDENGAGESVTPPATTPPPPEQTLEHWKDLYLRAVAEMQNARRRSGQEVEDRVLARMEGLLGDLLRVDEYFTAALASVPAPVRNAEGATAFLAGVQAIRQALETTLVAHGLQFVEPAPTAAFDPAEHEAVEVRQEPGAEPKMELLARGCRVGRRILRPARVRLIRPEPPAEP
jgi:molecular chaperone GrpE